ncbi:hypothetical protein [Chitinophaga sp. OAE865]|uniref:hypothetical protein n=1 Tax=Chitinophaga sp. OAE865 TaxID=2817898 RepID=UPI001AE351FA
MINNTNPCLTDNKTHNTEIYVSGAWRSIPSDIAVLVIADPGMPYSPEQLAQVNTFINKGREDNDAYLAGAFPVSRYAGHP